jgi:hypothetical protein
MVAYIYNPLFSQKEVIFDTAFRFTVASSSDEHTPPHFLGRPIPLAVPFIRVAESNDNGTRLLVTEET